MKKRKRMTKAATAKKLLWSVFTCVALSTLCSFILSLLDKDPLITITVTWITTGLGTFGVYLVRSYFEKKNLPPLPADTNDDANTGGSI